MLEPSLLQVADFKRQLVGAVGVEPTYLHASSVQTSRPSPRRFLRQELQTIDGKRSLDTLQIKMVGAKNLQVTKLIAQAQLVVGLELAAMAGSADTLKVFAAVWIAGS